MGNSQSTELQLAVMGNILLQREIPHTDRQFWERLLGIGLSAADIFDNFTLDFLRSLRDRRQQNFATLSKLLALQMHAVAWRQKQTTLMLTAASLTAPQQPTAPAPASVPAAAPISRTGSAERVAAAAAAAAGAGGASVAAVHPAVALEGLDGEKKQLLLNCIRLLSRVLAVVNEAPQEGMRQWLQGGVLQGMQELHEEDRRHRLQARQRKEKERRQQEESISRAKEIAAEKEKQDAVRREEERKRQQQELELRVQREAKEATQAAEAAQTRAREARQASAQAAAADGDGASPTHASPFSTTPASPNAAAAAGQLPKSSRRRRTARSRRQRRPLLLLLLLLSAMVSRTKLQPTRDRVTRWLQAALLTCPRPSPTSPSSPQPSPIRRREQTVSSRSRSRMMSRSRRRRQSSRRRKRRTAPQQQQQQQCRHPLLCLPPLQLPLHLRPLPWPLPPPSSRGCPATLSCLLSAVCLLPPLRRPALSRLSDGSSPCGLILRWTSGGLVSCSAPRCRPSSSPC